MDKNREVLMVAGQVRELITTEVFRWGQLCIDADADKTDEQKKHAAMKQGALVQELAVQLVKRLGT